MNFPLKIKAVVIDLDGTLLDTAPDLAYAAELMMAELGLPCPSQDTIVTYIGNGVSRLVKRVLTGDMDAEPDAALFEKAIASYNKHYSAHVSLHSRPFPGVVEGLQALKAMGLRVACITNKAEAFTHPLLKDTGLFEYFELILSGDTLPKRKPDPLPLLHACQALGITPAQTLYVGDSINDVEAATAAGMRVICVPYGYNEGKPVSALAATAFIDTLAELPALIAANAGHAKGFHSITSHTGERA